MEVASPRSRRGPDGVRMTDGWAESAAAWIADMGEEGDFGRRHVLDAPMIERVQARAYGWALDVGCGEGRFCRMMQARGISTVGIDLTAAFIEHARSCDPQGDYRIGVAEDLPFEDEAQGWSAAHWTGGDRLKDLISATRGFQA